MTFATQQPAPLAPATPAPLPPPTSSPRLLSLDVFRGLVILSMLLVNNLGDGATTGYFWKHADWPEPWLAQSFRDWSHHPSLTQFPLFRHCTLADYVMPSFMLIIGLAIPYSVAASLKRGLPPRTIRLRTLKRAATLVLLGWILCYFRDQFAPWLYGNKPFTISCGMDVLQLLGVAYLLARVIYQLPLLPRLTAAAILFLWHWAFLRFWPQGPTPAGTFTEQHNAVAYAYAHWPLWQHLTLHLGSRVTIGWAGLLSVPPAAATMLLGSAAGDLLRRQDLPDPAKLRRLACAGLALALVGFLWALFDLPFNKPRWTPCYLCWVAGIDFLLLSLLHRLIDAPPSNSAFRIQHSAFLTRPLLVFGSNAIAAYFLPILTKVLLLNTPRVPYAGQKVSLITATLLSLKHSLGPWLGGWTFTLAFVAFWWLVLDQMYRRKLFWKL